MTQSRPGYKLSAMACGLALFMVSLQNANAGVLTEAMDTVTYDFQQFSGFGFKPAPTPDPIAGLRLDSNHLVARGLSDGDVAFGATETSGDFARGASAGGVRTGGVYAFDVGNGNIALGVQPAGSDFTEGSFVFKVRNGGFTDIRKLQIEFDAYHFNDQTRSNFLVWEDSFNDTLYSDFGVSERLVSPEQPSAQPSWTLGATRTLSVGFAAGLFTPGADYFFRFRGNDLSGSGSRDEFAIDNVSFSAEFGSSNVVPEPGSFIVWAAICVAPLISSRRRSRREC